MSPRLLNRLLALVVATVLPLLAVALLLVHADPARAAGSVGSGSPASCTNAALDSALAGGGLVTFNCGGSPVVITITQKSVALTTTIDGGGLVTLTGNNLNALFTVSSTATLTLRNITLRDGNSGAYTPGGAIMNLGGLVIENSQLLNNAGHNGGAIYSSGRLVISNSVLAYNASTPAATTGGAIHNAGGQATISGGSIFSNTANGAGAIASVNGALTMTNVSVSLNTGYYNLGGVSSTFGRLTISGGEFFSNTGGLGTHNAIVVLSDLTVRGNRGFADGGGYRNVGGSATLTNVTFFSNTAPHGAGAGMYISSNAVVTMTDVTFRDNVSYYSGGGLYIALSHVTITGATFSGNRATDLNANGGAINAYFGTVSVSNATVSDNTAHNGGGILSSSGPMTLAFVTVTGNSAHYFGTAGLGGGVLGQITVTSSIIANNLLGGDCNIGGLVSGGYNLASDTSCDGAFTQPTDQTNVDPLLGPLQDNGGATLTRLPAATSPAVDQGGLVCPATDQRGLGRPAGAACDSGAVERQANEVSPTVYLYLPLVVR